MPLSLKKQRRNEKNRKHQHEERKQARKLAAEKLKTNSDISIRSIERKTGVHRRVLREIRTSIARNNSSSLKQLTSPAKRPGAQTVLTEEEEHLIVKHCLKAAKRGFAVDALDLKAIMGRIANDGRKKTYKTGVPSDDTIRSFRARHPELTYRPAENKERIKLMGENYFHVKTYEEALKSVVEEYPNIFDNGDLVWNMDETHVDGEFGKRCRVISASDTHHGGFCSSTAGTGNGRHITVVIAVSASGKKAPPFYIIEGKRNMSNWYLPLDSSEYQFEDGALDMLTKAGSL